MSIDLIPHLLVAALLSIGLVRVLQYSAQQLNLVDYPGGRKIHVAPTPVVGGIAIFVAFALTMLTVDLGSLLELAALFSAMLMVLVCGVVDDLLDLHSTTKLAAQIVAATVVVAWGGMVLEELAWLEGVGALDLGRWALPLTLFGIVGLINAVNMLDGLDGLAGGSSLAILFWLAVAAHLNGLAETPIVIAVLLAALAGFLPFNFRHPLRKHKQATAFLGDSGSMLLGLAIAWFAIDVARVGADAPVSPLAVGWIIALPVMDTFSLTLRRVLKGKNPFLPDREHLHHIFMRAGYQPAQASSFLVVIAFAVGGAGVFLSLQGVPDFVLAAGLLIAIALHFVFIRYAWRTIRALRRLDARRSAPPGDEPEPLDPYAALAPPVNGWRRSVALTGLYLMVFGIPLSVSLTNAGVILVLLATVASIRAFLRDMVQLPVFWLALLLTGYVALMSAVGAAQFPAVAEASVPHWRHVLRVTVLLSLPMAWWLAGARFHWSWLFWTLIAAAAGSFLIHADWSALRAGEVGDPENFGSPDDYASVAACVLVILFAVAVAAISRLGKGWRPVFALVVTALAGLPVLLLLVVSDYTTGWLGATVGILVVGVAAVLYGANRRQWAAVVGSSLLIAVVAGSAWYALHQDSPARAAVAEPLQAAALYLAGEPELARERDPKTADRLVLWSESLGQAAARPLVGWGVTSPASNPLPDVVSGSDRFRNFFLSFLVGYGALGVVLFTLTAGLLLLRLKRATRRGLVPVSIAVGLYGAFATMGTMLLLSTQINYTASRTILIMLFALLGALAVMRHWDRVRRRQCRTHGPGSRTCGEGAATAH